MKQKAIVLKCSDCDGKILLLYGVATKGIILVCDKCQAMINVTFDELVVIAMKVDKKPKKPKGNGKV